MKFVEPESRNICLYFKLLCQQRYKQDYYLFHIGQKNTNTHTNSFCLQWERVQSAFIGWSNDSAVGIYQLQLQLAAM